MNPSAEAEPGARAGGALHEAVRAGDCHLAARLLADGADPAPLEAGSVDVDTLHRIRQEYQRLPRAPWDAEPADAELRSLLARLRSDGLVRVSGWIEPRDLRRLQRDFRARVRRLKLARLFRRATFQQYDQEQYWHAVQRSYVANDGVRFSPTLLRFATDARIVTLAGHYLERRFHLKRIYGMRYLPSKPMHGQQFHWHHDMEDRQLKAMILLSDVGEADQYMTYVLRSHRAFHPYPRFQKNDLDFAYCESYLGQLEIVKTLGRAGDVFFFDSNGMHSGNRSLGAVRDALFVEFTADGNHRNIWGTALRRSAIPEALRASDGPLEKFLAVTPKWQRARGGKRRKRPTWAGSLEDPRNWL